MPYLEDEGKWHVVEFVSDESEKFKEAESEVVPDFWLDMDGKHVSWPADLMNTHQVLKAIFSRKIPENKV